MHSEHCFKTLTTKNSGSTIFGIDINSDQVCMLLASYPGPSRGGGERAWYTLHAHVPGDPRKMWDNQILSYTLRLLSTELYVMQNPPTITMVTRQVTMETPAHVRAVCTRPFLLLLLKGLGTRLACFQFCYILNIIWVICTI